MVHISARIVQIRVWTPDLVWPLDQELWFNQQSPKISKAGRILDLKSVSCNFEMARHENCYQIMLVKISVWYKFSKISKLCGWPLTFYIKKTTKSHFRKWPSKNLGIRILLIFRNKFGRNLIFLVKICLFYAFFLFYLLRFSFRLNRMIVMGVTVKWRIWFRKITLTISMKNERSVNIHIQGSPLMTLTAPVIITGKF